MSSNNHYKRYVKGRYKRLLAPEELDRWIERYKERLKKELGLRKLRKVDVLRAIGMSDGLYFESTDTLHQLKKELLKKRGKRI